MNDNDITERVLKRLLSRGHSIESPVPCRWKNKPGAVALTNGGVALASSMLTIQFVPYGSLRTTQVLGEGPDRALVLGGSTYRVGFADAEVADAFVAMLDRYRKKIIELAEQRRTSQLVARPENERLIPSCKYLGGAFVPLVDDAVYGLLASENVIDVVVPKSKDQAVLHTFPASPSLTVEFGGPGLVTSGGGWSSWGYGLTATLEGAAIASALNRLTTRQSITSIIAIADDHSEAFFLNNQLTPAQLRRALSPIFVSLRRDARGAGNEAATEPTTLPPDDSLVTKLERLGSLHERGVLDDSEFKTAKAALLRDE